jgi:hypothetical protein
MGTIGHIDLIIWYDWCPCKRINGHRKRTSHHRYRYRVGAMCFQAKECQRLPSKLRKKACNRFMFHDPYNPLISDLEFPNLQENTFLWCKALVCGNLFGNPRKPTQDLEHSTFKMQRASCMFSKLNFRVFLKL